MPVVRDARTDDAAAMSRVQARSWRAAYRGIVPDDFLDGLSDDAWEERWARSLAGSLADGVDQLVSTTDGRVVAVAACGPSRGTDAPATGELYLIYTDPDHWGAGHGSSLLTEVHDRLAAIGHAEAMLWVAADNERSIGFYRHWGWELDGRTKRDEGHGASILEARMVRSLP